MRVTGPMLKVVRALLDAATTGEETYGLAICRATGLKGGTVYPILDRLEAAGWVQARREDVEPSDAKRPRRRFYAITAHGAHEAHYTIADLGFGLGPGQLSS